MAWPALAVLAATPLYILWDTAVVGRLGAESLAALGAGATVLAAITTQLTFLSYGTTARAARLYGAGRVPDALYEGVQATWVALGVGGTLACAVWLATPHIMEGLTGGGDVAEQATTWMRVTCLSVVPALVVMAGNGWLRGLSNTRLPLVATLVGVIPMALTVPVAVRRYGLVGSAYANVLGEVLVAGCFLAFLALYWRTHGDGRTLRPQWGIIRRQLVAGRDLILRSVMMQVGFFTAAAVAGRMGAAQLAAHQVLLQLWFFLSLVLDSVAIAAQSLVGAALGAGDAPTAKSVGRRVIGFSLAAGGVVAGVLAVFHGIIPGLFTTDRSVVSAMAGPWWLLVVMVVVGSFAFAVDGVLLGASDFAFLRSITAGSVVVGFLPVVALSWVCGWGLVGIWVGLLLFMTLRALAVGWRFQSGVWARRAVAVPDAVAEAG